MSAKAAKPMARTAATVRRRRLTSVRGASKRCVIRPTRTRATAKTGSQASRVKIQPRLSGAKVRPGTAFGLKRDAGTAAESIAV